MIRVTFSSTNQGKMREIQSFLHASNLPVQIILPNGLGDVAETGKTFLENALLKARSAIDFSHSKLIIAEDSGFEIPALNGQYGLSPFPGIHSNRWMDKTLRTALIGIEGEYPATYPELNQGIMTLMQGKTNRQCAYVSALVCIDATGNLLFQTEGRVRLNLLADGASGRGIGGFGYDPIVTLDACELPADSADVLSQKTLAELDTTIKNRFSHRGKALRKWAEFLKTHC